MLEHVFDRVLYVARVSWWWNGKWGRLARRDVEIHHEPESWLVEARQGGPEGESKRFAAASEGEARHIADQLMHTDERWRSMG
jgi:hypothetical protein